MPDVTAVQEVKTGLEEQERVLGKMNAVRPSEETKQAEADIVEARNEIKDVITHPEAYQNKTEQSSSQAPQNKADEPEMEPVVQPK